ncbi:MAG: MMPL family transporter [Planctomycetaceae bacterium]|jgi:predicted RND superfamily exporter protein|nr:MMPL family transporter [Planctomycetaceae bacterium]
MRNEFFKRYGFRILVIIFFLLPFVWMGTKRTLMSNSNNVADWLPNSFVETQQYQWFLKNFPFERFVVVSWQGCTMDDSRLEMFAQKLVPGQTIDNVGQWADEHIKAELILEPEKTVPAAPKNESARENTTPETTAPSEIPQANESAEPENQPENLPEHLNYFKSVITGPRLFRILKDRYSGSGIGGIRLTEGQIREKLRGTLIGPDGQNSALIVTLTKEAPQGKDLAKVLEAIRDIGRECGVHAPKKIDHRPIYQKVADGIITTIKEIIYGRHPDMTGVIIGGPPVDNVAITHEGEHTLRRLAGICGIIGLFLAWLCFRDFRLTFFVFWIAIISAGVALASVSLTRGTCDAILLSMPALVYVLAMSGAIHLINYYHDAIREHGLDMAPERAVKHAWSPCFFANLTTALGLLSLYTSHLVPITKFGFYSALGVLLQLVLLFYYLPTLLHFYPSHKVASEQTLHVKYDSVMQKIWRIWGGFVIRNNIIISLICIVLMIFFCYGMYQIKTSVKMMRFFSGDSEIIHHYTWLEEQLGPLVPMEIVVKFNNAQCKFSTLERLRLIEDIDDELRKELSEDIGGVISAETMMPMIPRFEGTRKSARQIAIERTANAMLEKGRSEMKDYVTVECERSLRSDDPRFQQTVSELGITAADAARLVRVGITDLKQLLNYSAENEVVGISPEEMQTFCEKAVQWEKNHGYDLWRISIRVWSLKKDIDYAMFIQDVKNVIDPIIAKMVERHFPQEVSVVEPEHRGLGFTDKPIEAVYTGMVPVVYKTQHELLTGLRDSFVTSFLMIAVTMSFILRSPLAGLCAMIPNLFPVIVVFGFMGQFGILVDVGTMMTASVALGISVDDTIHFLTWFRDGIDQGMTQREATMYAYSRCATSMFQTTMIAGLGLSAFALSTFTPTQMFGIMMLAILTMAMLGDLIFLAALINTPIGRVFRPRAKKQTPAEYVANS